MHKKEKGERFLPKINYIRIAMYKYLVSLQRYAIYVIQQITINNTFFRKKEVPLQKLYQMKVTVDDRQLRKAAEAPDFSEIIFTKG